MAERDPGSSDSEGEDPDYALHSEPPSGKASLSSLPVLLPDPVDPAVVETVTSYAEATSGMVPRLELPGSSKVDGSQGLSKMLGLVGKSLSTISMPVNINEPLDTMQRLCEELHYCHLLDQAASEPDAGKRLLYIAAFAVSGVGTTAFHSSKPFNPLLGQTYEFISPERGFRFIAEQVSHHPPVSAAHAESRNWEFSQDASAKTSFRGSYLKVSPLGKVRVKLHTTNETFSWHKCTSTIDNILSSAKRAVSHYGKVEIRNETTGDLCVLDFVKAGRFAKSKKNDVNGSVFLGGDTTKAAALNIVGKWNTAIECPQLKEVLWKIDDAPDRSKSFGFTPFAMSLNQLPPEGSMAKSKLCVTDTRLRPDQRLLEEGETDAAQAEKLRLEDLQRKVRAKREEEQKAWKPRFFSYVRTKDGGKEEAWLYNRNYWQQRQAGEFEACHQLW